MDDAHITVLIILVLLVIGFTYRVYSQDSDEHMKNVNSRRRAFLINQCGCGGKGIESFAAYNDDGEYYDTLVGPQDYLAVRGNLFPWWNSTRHTRNMSWDLRGDVLIKPHYVGPWLNSPLI